MWVFPALQHEADRAQGPHAFTLGVCTVRTAKNSSIDIATIIIFRFIQPPPYSSAVFLLLINLMKRKNITMLAGMKNHGLVMKSQILKPVLTVATLM